DHHPVNRRARHVALQWLPVLAVVERQVQTVLSANIEQTRTYWIFSNAMRVTQHAARNAVRDCLPRLAVILRLVDERIAIVPLMKIYGEIRGARSITRGLDVADSSPLRQVRNVLRDVGPILAAVAR